LKKKKKKNSKKFMDLQMADYALVGVTSVRDRKRLFQLIQSLNGVAAPSKSKASNESPFARTLGSPAELALLFSPNARRSVDAFDAEKDRALALMDEIDLKYTSSAAARSPSPVPVSNNSKSVVAAATSVRTTAGKPRSSTSPAVPAAKVSPVVSAASSENVPVNKAQMTVQQMDRGVLARAKSLKSVNTTKRAAARAAANKQAPGAKLQRSSSGAVNNTGSPSGSVAGSDTMSPQRVETPPVVAQVLPPPPQPVASLPPPPPQTLPLANMAPDIARALQHKIRVCVRKRPLNSRERRANEADIVSGDGDSVLCVHEPKLKLDLTPYTEEHSFQFDEVFDEAIDNEEVYRRTARPLVAAIFKGARATCFAYGQTGSGKTHTMLGDGEGTLGLYMLAARDLFAQLGTMGAGHVCTVSFFEIYGGKLFDLLANRTLCHARDNGQGEVVIRGLSSHVVANEHALLECVRQGSESRSVGTTAANADSSRSHAVLQLTVGRRNDKPIGKLSFIDLAGSERGSETGKNLDKQTRLEGAEINKSLLALKECIRALDQDSRHLPFRQSTLTQVLKDSFVGGITRTVMIATVSPNSSASEHTLNTLRYADRVKELGTGGANKQMSESYAALTAAPTVIAAPPQQVAAAAVSTAPLAANNGGDETPAKRRHRVSLTPRKLLNRKSSISAGIAAATPARTPAAAAAAAPQQQQQQQQLQQQALVTPRAQRDVDDADDADDGTLIDALSEVVVSHRSTIDNEMALLKREMKLLDVTIDKSVEPQIDIYIAQLDEIIELKAATLLQMRERLDAFKAEFMP
jgi:hypothetical protein